MNGPSNIKIQKAGAEEIGNAHICSPASDLQRWEAISAVTGLRPCANQICIRFPQRVVHQGR